MCFQSSACFSAPWAALAPFAMASINACPSSWQPWEGGKWDKRASLFLIRQTSDGLGYQDSFWALMLRRVHRPREEAENKFTLGALDVLKDVLKSEDMGMESGSCRGVHGCPPLVPSVFLTLS